MILGVVSLLLLQKKGLTISSHSTQNTITTQIHKINNINFQSNCTHIASLFHPSFFVYKIKDVLIISEMLHFTNAISKTKQQEIS